jgi:hypothetical protein
MIQTLAANVFNARLSLFRDNGLQDIRGSGMKDA